MSLGLLNEDMEMLNEAYDTIDKLVSASPDPITPLGFCNYDCEGSCSNSCAGSCMGNGKVPLE